MSHNFTRVSLLSDMGRKKKKTTRLVIKLGPPRKPRKPRGLGSGFHKDSRTKRKRTRSDNLRDKLKEEEEEEE